MIKSLKIAVLALFVSVLAFSGSSVSAASAGQLAGGDNYVVKNVTKGGAYANSVSATCNEEVKFSMQLSNTQFGALENVKLSATLPSTGGTSTATATTALGGATGTTDTASVTLGANQTIAYEAGSTVLYDDSGNVIRTLGDGVTAGGVDLGTIEGSTTKFVNFKAKVNCAEKPVCTVNCTPETPKTPETPGVTPTAIASTGPAEIISGLFGTSALGYGVQRYVASRRQK